MKQLLWLLLSSFIFLTSTIFSQNSEWVSYNNGDYISAMAEEGDHLWICTWGGLVKINKKNGDRFFYDKLNSGLINNRISCIATDNLGNKWIADGYWWIEGTGLTKFDGTNWEVFNTSNSELPSNQVRSIAVDELDNIWIGTENGLAKFDGINWQIFHSSNSILPTNEVNCITIDEGNTIWIGTNLGLAKFDGINWEVYNNSKFRITK